MQIRKETDDAAARLGASSNVLSRVFISRHGDTSAEGYLSDKSAENLVTMVTRKFQKRSKGNTLTKKNQINNRVG